jgi:hypothetical protein
VIALAWSVAVLVPVARGAVLLVAGLRAGDRLGDVVLAPGPASADGATLSVTVHNPGSEAVLVGLTLRRRTLRLRAEGGRYANRPWRGRRRDLQPTRHASIAVVQAGAADELQVPIGRSLPRRAQLVAVIGQTARLRVIHLAVTIVRGPASVSCGRPSLLASPHDR